MKALIAIICVSLFFACRAMDSKFVRKKIGNNSIAVQWYFYSGLTDLGDEIVDVSRKNDMMQEVETKRLLTAGRNLLDINVVGDTIVVKFVKDSSSWQDMKNIPSTVFNHPVRIDSSGTFDDIKYVPDGIKEARW